jgi:2-keto-4-pentenoate hydratase/2-oxohepta-3-ene-1,7-dioic acid hydratase in catechol pathway
MKPKQPFFFLKPTSSIIEQGESCLRPKGVIMHFEVELALIIGKVVRDLKADDKQGALDAIQGALFLPGAMLIGFYPTTSNRKVMTAD